MKITATMPLAGPGKLEPSAGLGLPAKGQPLDRLQFGDVLANMMRDVDSTLRSAEKLSIGALTGDVPLQKVVETVVAAEQKVQLTTSVRDKIVAAYLELTRMPI